MFAVRTFEQPEDGLGLVDAVLNMGLVGLVFVATVAVVVVVLGLLTYDGQD